MVRSTKMRLEVVCTKGDCKWRLRATKVKDSDQFFVRKYQSVHSCHMEVDNGCLRQATSRLIGELYKHNYESSGKKYKPAEIMESFRRDFGVEVSYSKARRALEIALNSVRGSREESAPSGSREDLVGHEVGCEGRGDNGRSKKKRISSQGEHQPTKKCGRCAEVGHYKSTCKRRLPLKSTNEEDRK